MTPSARVRCATLGWMAAVLGTAACATTPEPIGTEALIGCWYFEQGSAPPGLRLPWGVRLAEGPLEGWPALQARGDVRVAETLTAAAPRDFPIGYWRTTAEGDSLEMGYPAGGGLLVSVAVPRGGEEAPALDGAVAPVGDAVEPGGRASSGSGPHRVRLTSARCP